MIRVIFSATPCILSLGELGLHALLMAHCKNRFSGIPGPQPECHLPNFPWPGIIYPVPGRFGPKNPGIS